jgi:hypothetical protein
MKADYLNRRRALTRYLPLLVSAVALTSITSTAQAQIQSVVPTITVSPSTALPGEPLTVSWAGAVGGSASDWIGLYDLAAPNTAFRCVIRTKGAESGSVLCDDAVNLGRFEFRYLVNDSYESVAKSNMVTIEPPTGFTLSLSDNATFGNGAITVNWMAPAGRPATDWIGLYRHGEEDNRKYDPVQWVFTGGATSGSHTFRMPTAPGEYVFRYLLRNAYIDVSESAIVTVTPFSVSVNKSWLYKGATLSTSFTAPPGQPWADWIGLYRVGEPNTACLDVIRTQGAVSGTFTRVFTCPAGLYEFRYVIDNGFNVVAISNPFKVYEPVGFQVTSPVTVAMPGQTIQVNWVAPAGTNAKDWIGLFAVGTANREVIAWVWTGGTTSGTAAFKLPKAAGIYEFRYLLDNNYVDVARSATITSQ